MKMNTSEARRRYPQAARHFNGRVVGSADLEQHQMDTGNDQAEQASSVHRDVDFLQRVHRLQSGVVEGVVLLSNGLLLRPHEFVDGLACFD